MHTQVVSISQSLQINEAGAFVISIDEQGQLCALGQTLPEESQIYIQQRFDEKDISGKLASTHLLFSVPESPTGRIIVIGRGDTETPLTTLKASKLVDATAKFIAKLPYAVALSASGLINSALPENWWLKQLVMALHAKQYQFSATKPSADTPAEGLLSQLFWVTEGDQADALALAAAQGDAIGAASNYAKELGNMPPNIATPTYLAQQAEALAEDGTFTCKVYDEKELEAMGAGSFVSVAKGSSEPGKIIVLSYQGAADKDEAPHMLLGKGITFDTGGISLKPGARMDEMKYDMCGAASVLATMQAVKALKPSINIIGMVTSAENMPSGHASKPGDVVTSLSGKTIEILNTDAEGRLVLCDAMTLGIREYAPASIVDIATLTGACMAALGKVNSGLFTTDDSLADELKHAAADSNDKVWQLPLEEDYQSLLDSNFADMANIGGPLAGATTAACFLARFAEETPWAHLDIAGSAWDGAGTSKGSTGRPVPLLCQYLLNKAS